LRLCKRHLRLFLSLLAAALVCVVSRSALADAPQCDARAATTYAPNPKLQSSTAASVDVGPSDCASDVNAGNVLQRGHAPTAPDASDAQPRADVPAGLRVLPATPTAVLALFERTFTVPAGVKGRVDRPPRA
jgi:hypothetical protein